MTRASIESVGNIMYALIVGTLIHFGYYAWAAGWVAASLNQLIREAGRRNA